MRALLGRPDVELILRSGNAAELLASLRSLSLDVVLINQPPIHEGHSRLVAAGCFAEFELTDESLRKFRARNGTGKVTFKNAAGRDIVIPLSFKGFAQAFGALAKE